MLNKSHISLLLASVWLVFTGALILWWMYFALSLIDELDSQMIHHRNMLLWEGATLLLLLLAGGATLVYFIFRERHQADRLKYFFASFTHDLKTSLTGVRLLAESLREDIKTAKSDDHGLLDLSQRLLTDTSRLQTQVENVLFQGIQNVPTVYLEPISLKKLMDVMSESWPRLNIVNQKDALLTVDRRSIEGILNNIFQNAILHGKAQIITVEVLPISSTRIRIVFTDNGKGFSGDWSKLGEKLFRHNTASGSGLGLNTAISYAKTMGARLDFSSRKDNKGFMVNLEVEGKIL